MQDIPERRNIKTGTEIGCEQIALDSIGIG
jgi:hypothetical protein